MRKVARRFMRDVHCHRMFLNAEPIPGIPMRRAVQELGHNERQALMVWLDRRGPFWDDSRDHHADDWLECQGEIVTDSAVGEAAYRSLHGVESGLVSVTPSDWNFSPVEVIWRREAGLDDRNATLENWWDAVALEEGLQEADRPIQSWAALRDFVTNRFGNLTFADPCFEPLAGTPFAKSAAKRILELLDILDQYSRAFDAKGESTPEGHQIYQDYFKGERALFSDSSTTEKRKFRKELTFPHPDHSGEFLFCTWHGKVSHRTLRLHFSWPIRAGESVYIVYAGPKLTKR